jgi:acetoin utilization deacetylase AcuC-like enzyme
MSDRLQELALTLSGPESQRQTGWVAWHMDYAHPLPEGHRFPMEKYNLLPEQLLFEGTLSPSHFFQPGQLNDQVLHLAHTPEYVNELEGGSISPKAMRKTGFPWSEQLVQRERRIMQGTIQAALHAVENRIGFNIAGGTHHAFREHGEGFCLYNDLALTAFHLLQQGIVRRVLIVDLDVHQGNGTAGIMQGVSEVFTFSMHGEKNYPFRKMQSSLDLSLSDGIGDKEYLKLLDYHLNRILDDFAPDFMLYQCGVDILETDALGRMGISIAGCRERDRLVFKAAERCAIPVCASMGGGYSPQIRSIIEAHANTFRVGLDILG